MKYKVILFDADGVTINHSTLFSDELETDYGITKETTNEFFSGIFQDCMVGKADLKEELAKVVGPWGRTVSWPPIRSGIAASICARS